MKKRYDTSGGSTSGSEDESAVGHDSIEQTADNRVSINARVIEARIAKLFNFTAFESKPRFWLDTGSKDMNGVFGSKKRGIAYGKIIEIRGEEHAGKSTISKILAGMAQREGAGVGRIDLEDDRDTVWDTKLGLDVDSIVTIYPQLGYKGKNKQKVIMKSAEQMFEEAEAAMELLRKEGCDKQFWWIDSVAQIQTAMQVDAGSTKKNMRTAMDRAQFLSSVLPHWAALAANYNAIIVLVNQLRDNIGVRFGPTETSPGGRAMRHNCAVRVNVRRIKNGKLIRGARVIGIRGKAVNFKNKSGGGSNEGRVAAYKINWGVKPVKIEFMSLEEAVEE